MQYSTYETGDALSIQPSAMNNGNMIQLNDGHDKTDTSPFSDSTLKPTASESIVQLLNDIDQGYWQSSNISLAIRLIFY